MTLASTATEVFLASAAPNTVGPPPAPKGVFLSLAVSGSLAARQENVIVTGTNASGESPLSPEVSIQVPAGYVVVVTPPYGTEIRSPGGATGWNVYMTTGNSLTETKQNTAGALGLGTPFQEPSTGLIAGAALPNNIASVPSLADSNNNLANTPPATGNLTPPFSPSGAVNTNTGRSQTATQTAAALTGNPLYGWNGVRTPTNQPL